MHCLADYAGCRHDAECGGEPTWKCCDGPCQYKECLPSTLSPKPAELERDESQQLPPVVPPSNGMIQVRTSYLSQKVITRMGIASLITLLREG